MEEKKKKGKSSIIRKLILVVCVGVFIFSAYNLVSIFYGYYKIDKDYEDIKTEYVKEENDKYLIIDWQKLLERNPDVIAWISIPDTNIDYPVLKGATNDTYLRTNIDKQYSIAGCIFVDTNNQAPFQDMNTVIYGHHMKSNAAMFTDLMEYLDPAFLPEHANVYVYLPDGTVSKYNIISTHEVDATDENVYNTNVTDVPLFYENVLKKNKLVVEFDQTQNKPIISLSTCATYDVNNTARVVVHAALERSGIDPKKEKMK